MDWPISLRLWSFFALIAVGATSTKDYCHIFGCGVNHIACHNNGNFGKSCPSNKHMVNIIPFRSMIVDLHNSKRNKIAAGNKILLPAARMGEMVWDKELAKMAQLQVKTCDFKSEKCRSLPRFRYSGQNNAMYTYSRMQEVFRTEWLLRHLINNWLAESQNATMSVIKMYPRVTPKPVIGHFTVTVAESNNAIGCAAIRFKRKEVYHFMLTCNYATTNLIGRSIYSWSNETASECKKGRSAKYRNLCSTNEVYNNVNP